MRGVVRWRRRRRRSVRSGGERRERRQQSAAHAAAIYCSAKKKKQGKGEKTKKMLRVRTSRRHTYAHLRVRVLALYGGGRSSASCPPLHSPPPVARNRSDHVYTSTQHLLTRLGFPLFQPPPSSVDCRTSCLVIAGSTALCVCGGVCVLACARVCG